MHEQQLPESNRSNWRRNPSRIGPLLVWAAAMVVVLAGGCERAGDQPGQSKTSAGGEARLIGPDTSPVAVDMALGWCGGHGVPESVCTRCNSSLIDAFKKAGDWCADHGLPESQCELCNPGVDARWAALNPDADHGHEPAPADAPQVRVERSIDSLRPENDSLCNVETNLIRFIDATIVRKAGLEVAPATPQRIFATVQCPAEVRYDRTRFARVTPRAEGIVMEAAADLGDSVQAGEKLAVVDSPVMGEARANYIEAAQAYELAKAALMRHNGIHDGLERLIEACAEDVESDELRRRFTEVRIGEFKARLLGAHAQLRLARQRFGREQGLTERGISSQESYQTAKRDLAQAEAGFAAAIEAIDIEMEAEHLDLERSLTVAEAAMAAAHRRLSILGVSDEAIKSLSGGSDGSLSAYVIASPMAGRIVEREAVVGESVNNADTLFVVADTSRMWLLLNLEERDLAAIAVGDRVIFTVDGLPGRSFEGRLDWISSQVQEPTRTILGRVPMDNADGMLRAHMFGQARVIVRAEEEVLVVPDEAIQTDGCCSIVFLQESPTTFRPRKVGLGVSVRGAVEVLSGLAAGEPVVTGGSFLLKTEILKSSIGAGCCEVDPGR